MLCGCYICRKNDEDWNSTAVAICNELNQPVCAKHARGCDEDGHGSRPIEDK